MYSTCLYCNTSLGSNEVVEHFPVGRRLAFDPARGRLWAVCPSCARWNLTPLEERWEAIETCERLFRDTRLRASTDHIGLARLREGLELVRIGQPQRPEFAAWRYGEVFRRRRRRTLILTAIGGTTIGALQLAAQDFMLAWWVLLPALSNAHNAIDAFLLGRGKMRSVVRVTTEDGSAATVRGKHVDDAMLLLNDDGSGWRLRVDHRKGFTVLEGDAASRTLGRLLAHTNYAGGNRKSVDSAVAQLSLARSADEFILHYAKRVNRESHYTRRSPPKRDPESLGGQSAVDRLALEMALHEETERAAMEGELSALEDAWKEAEEIAAIADNLLLPSAIAERLGILRSPPPD
ncbi:MAG: hypothetical protein IT359_17720 [Gemmatimonadaceae bacterium]|nr:hypothetical protein [Gemmatimonadaceae bacterium]